MNKWICNIKCWIYLRTKSWQYSWLIMCIKPHIKSNNKIPFNDSRKQARPHVQQTSNGLDSFLSSAPKMDCFHWTDIFTVPQCSRQLNLLCHSPYLGNNFFTEVVYCNDCRKFLHQKVVTSNNSLFVNADFFSKMVPCLELLLSVALISNKTSINLEDWK